MVDKEREQEIWKTYPEFPWIEVSNLGRVRTKDRWIAHKDGSKRLIKGRILKQQSIRGGYMRVSIHTNGKTVSLLVHRMVAICFLPNPNSYPEVNHIDNNRKNNVANNLEWCTRQYNNDYKKNFGTSPAEVLGRPVFAVNLKTGKVLRFESQSEAGRQLGINQSDITKVIKGKSIQTGGYWFTEDESEITKEKIQEIRASMHFFGGVFAINLDTFEVLCFGSQSEAARQLGFSQSNIYSVLKGYYNKTHGYWFCYVDENVMVKIRAKFGDKIVKKIEELMHQLSYI